MHTACGEALHEAARVFVSRIDTLQGGEFLMQIVLPAILKNLEEFQSYLATRSVSWIRPWMSEHGQHSAVVMMIKCNEATLGPDTSR